MVGRCRWDIGILPKSSQRMGTRGYHNLAPLNLDYRNERFRLIAFQNTQNFLNRPSINIFLVRRKLMENRKFSKFSNQSGYKIHRFQDLLSKIRSALVETASYKKNKQKCAIFLTHSNSFFSCYIWYSINK